MTSVPLTLTTRTATGPGARPAGAADTAPAPAPGPEARRLLPTPAELAGVGPHEGTDRSLTDGFGRVHRDLRVSLTDKCSLRCTYCMPEDAGPFMPKDQLLSAAEIERLVRIAVDHGITGVRLTGGEPLLRQDLEDIVARLAGIELSDAAGGGRLPVAMTTNGITLDRRLPALHEAGLSRVNISIDTLQPEKFHQLTRRDRHADVLAGIAAARDAGLRPLKLNAVAMRGVNDDELADLVAFAVSQDAQMRFIEQMPLDAGHTWKRDNLVSGEEILARLAERFDLAEVPGRGSSPAALYTVDGGPHTVGVIASVSKPFCGDCDRLRLTADGQMRNCLFAREETDLRTLLWDSASDADLAAAMKISVGAKKAGHGIDDPDFVQPGRGMNAIGG
ncbi:GTP 3',8-cyclase MoaA [Citricoccus alkalitolerans]|uniref:GTP 3',8-cyclase n=1 Tax=Citricoccus alkalitolerans TaxID=246603 RepID=A0ABV8XXQ5_9MICC